MTIEVEIKKWGNSIGIIIPAEEISKLNLRPKEKVMINIEKKTNVLKEMFGAGKDIKKPTSQILKEIRKDLESKWWKQKNA